MPPRSSTLAGTDRQRTSVADHEVRAGGAVYSATRHAVRVISERLRQDVKPWNIHTTVVSPGAAGVVHAMRAD